MGLGEIRHQVRKLCWRLLVGKIDVRKSNYISELDDRATPYDWEKSESRKAGFGERGEILRESAAAFAATRRADTPSNQGSSIDDIVRGVLGRNSNAAINNVLVLGTEGSPPMKRVEIRFADPTEVSVTFKRLAVAFQTSGADIDTGRHSGIPANEIWVTSALHDGKKALLSCAAMVGIPVTQHVVASPGLPRT